MTSGWLAASAVSLLVLSWLLARLRRHRRRSPAPILILDGGMGLELKQRKAEGLPVAYDLKLFSTAALRDPAHEHTARARVSTYGRSVVGMRGGHF